MPGSRAAGGLHQRVLAAGGSVRIQAATLADLTERFSDVARAGSELLRRPAVLDGVVAVLDTILDAAQVEEAHHLATRVHEGLSSGELKPTGTVVEVSMPVCVVMIPKG